MQTQEEHIINKFREMIAKRYNYEEIQARYQLGENVDAAMIEGIKNYFLHTVYPEAQRRKELEDAFKELATYMRQPKKIWGLFGNLAGAVFKFGKHFVSALKSGFSALDSFVGAKKFEASLVIIANKNDITIPITDDDFDECIYQLEREDVEAFIKHVKSLFEAMINTELLRKTIQILDNVVDTMQSKPHLYPQSDIEGIKLGRNLLQEGFDLFSKYDEPTKKLIVDIIYKTEMWNIEEIFRKREQ